MKLLELWKTVSISSTPPYLKLPFYCHTEDVDSVLRYGIENALEAVDIRLKLLHKKNSKRQYPPWEVYLQHAYRKRVETSNSLMEQLLPKSIHAVTADGFELKVFFFIITTNIKQLFT